MNAIDLLWILVFLPIVLMSVQVSRRIFNYWFTPLSVFVGINSMSLVFFHLRLLPMDDVSLQAHLIALVSFAMFFLGVLLATAGRKIDGSVRVVTDLDATSLDRFFLLTFILATIGWVLGSLLLIRQFGIGILLGNIWMLQNEFQMQYLGYLNLIGILVLPTYFIRRGLGRVGRLDLVMVVLSLLGLLLAGIKAYLVYSVLAGVFAWSVMRPNKFRLVHLGAGMFILLGFFVLYSAKIDIFTEGAFSGTGVARNFKFLFRPYYYFVGSWPAMNPIVDGTLADLPRFGTITLQPVWKLLGAVGLVEVLPPYNQFVTIGEITFNVYGFAGDVFWDFKWPGILILPGLLGFLSTRLYGRAMNAPFWGHALVYAVVGYGIFMSFFAYIFTFNMFVILTYVYVVGFVLLRRGVLVDGKPDE